MGDQPRVVVALPDRAECTAVAQWLTAGGLVPITRSTVRAAQEEMDARPFDLLVADAPFVLNDGLRPGGRVRSARTPIIVIGNAAEGPREDAISDLAIYVTRPLDQATFICFVSMAILEGRPARRSVRRPVNHVHIFMNGLPVRLLDVSNEGLRVELPPGRTPSLRPYFTVRIPFMGVDVTVQRKWSQPGGAGASVTWCGGALAQNRPNAEHAWRSFVETIPVPENN